jgi:phospholipase C
VLKLIEEKWNLPSLTHRDAAATSPLGAIDLNSPPAFLTPPNLAAAGAGPFKPMNKGLPRPLARFLTPGRH